MNRESGGIRDARLGFLTGGGEMASLIRDHAWASTPLGPIVDWPQSLKTATGMILLSPVPIVMLWGEDGIMIYNDAYSRFAGRRHPQLLGAKVREGWPEVADFNDHVMKVVLSGGTLSYHDQELTLDRNDGPEQVCMNLDYSPVPDEDGKPAGVIAIVVETTKQVKAAGALRQSEAHLAALLAQTAAGVAETDLEGRFTNVNDRYCRMVGRSRDELLSLRMQDITDPNDLPRNLKLVGNAIKTGEPFEIEKRYLRPDGSAVWVNNTVTPIRTDGKVTSVLAVSIDISDRKHALDALHEGESRFREVFENASVGMVEIDSNWRILGVNAAYSEIAGRAPEELIGDSCLAFTDPADIAKSEAALRRAAAEGKVSFEKRYRRKDGSPVWVRSNLSRVSSQGADVRFLKVIEDITDRRAAEEALAEETRTLETLNRTGAALAAELELEAVAQLVTDAGVELTGARFGAFFYNVRDEAGEGYMLYTLSGVDRSAFEGFPMPRKTAVFGPTFEGKGVVRSSDITKDPRYGKNSPHKGMPKGHLPVVSYLAVPVTGRSGEVIGGLFFGHPKRARFTERHERLMLGLAAQAAVAMDNARLYQDISRANETLEQRVEERTAELETANEALRQAQKMEAIGQLTGGIAHDFNNMLTVIRGSADVLQRGIVDGAKRERYLQAIADTADRAARLTSQLLAFARRQALKPEVFDVEARVRGIGDMLRTVLGSRIRVQIESRCNACFVEADAAHFETALLNMAVNARDAMDGEGELRIEVNQAKSIKPFDGPQVESGYVTVSVTDTGHGISREDLDKIFEPFFTTKETGKGTGLGLSQVYGFAKQSGGEVEVRSRPGEGTTFTMYLPRVSGVEHLEETAAEPELAPHPGGCVLVVEDNHEVGLFAEHVLAELGFETRRAATAAEALALLDSGACFDVVFSDIVMPGQSGIDLAREIRKRWPGVPVVLTTGYSDALAMQHEHSLPVLHKPYSLEALSDALTKALAP